jgi:hypothetical protein
MGTCQPLRANGEPCLPGEDDTCASGICSSLEGVCCNSFCDGSCETCATGTCQTAGYGTDPKDICESCSQCDGQSSNCTYVPSGETGPHSYCDQEPPSTCGYDGTCNGSGGCRLWSNKTICLPAGCYGGAMCDTDSKCDGWGDCLYSMCAECSSGECTPDGSACEDDNPCEPDCAQKECGDDGCGGSCGVCGGMMICNGYYCEECFPDCPGDCGPDGCGGSCGECPHGDGWYCDGTFCRQTS